ncbi:RNase adapter RapZ [Geopsychrobacter electrodiphilus]|uniref:RNase adapter RapZ n=1 Tax=Geopsychrobacter electrodiphilus TaxID=225196 RepID=UPI0003633C4E|nr:RNase adapter RapZ [Geopsychrobacter electrodiphilus]
MSKRPVYILTGLSGSGKSTAAQVLEDRGFFVIDNLPLPLLPRCLKLTSSRLEAAQDLAVVIDVRNRDFLLQYDAILKEVAALGHPMQIIFFEASDEILLRRYSETRRRHPLASVDNLSQAISRERELLQEVRGGATRVINSSGLRTQQLKEMLLNIIDNSEAPPLMLQIVSFGYRYGVPTDADLVFDVRFLPNPHYVPELKALTGLNLELQKYVLEKDDCQAFIDHLDRMLAFLLPCYYREGKSNLTLAIGCTGGRHRSVSLVEEFARRLGGQEIRVQVHHRDIEK